MRGFLVSRLYALRNRAGRIIQWLDPEGEWALRRGRYSFTGSQEITLGEACSIDIVTSPDVPIKPDRLIINMPCNGFAMLHNLIYGNQAMLVGVSQDMNDYSALSIAVGLKTEKWLLPGQKMKVRGQYTGFCPLPFTKGQKFLICITAQGPTKADLL